MEDQKNFFLAIVLSGLLVLGYWFVFAKPLAEQRAEAARIEAAQQAVPDPVVTPAEPRTRAELVAEGQRIPIETPSLSGSFQTTGFRVDDIELKNYDATLAEDSPNVELLTPEGAAVSAYVFDNWVRVDAGSGTDAAWALIEGTSLTPSTPVVLQHDGDGFQVVRTVSVDDDYLITLDDRVTNTTSAELSLVRRGASRQHGLPTDLTNFFILQEGPIAVVDETLFDMKYGKIRKESTATERGQSGWVGLTDKYWLSAAIAPQNRPMQATFGYRTVNDAEVYEAAYALDPLTLTPGATIESTGHIFAGAKVRSVLERYEDELGIARMDLAIDWGLLSILTRPMSWALTTLGQAIGNYGLGIMALTLILKVLMFPLYNKQYASQAKMKKIQPKATKLREIYGDDRLKIQQETMALYRKEGVNPAAGCLPIIPTIFIFFALYKAVFINVNLRHAPFFGYIQDLSAPDPLSILNLFGILPWGPNPIGIAFLAIGPLALLYGATFAMMQTLNSTGGDPMQRKIFAIMPWVFMFIIAPFAAGLLVYWVWNNVLSFIQQYIITRKFGVETPMDRFFNRLLGREPKLADGVDILEPDD